MYGPPGTGKTLLARACAAQTNSTYLKLAGPQLVQVNIMICDSLSHQGNLNITSITSFFFSRCLLVTVPNLCVMLSI